MTRFSQSPPGQRAAPKHATIAATIRRAIEDGTFGPRARLPSVRRLARAHGASVSTVARALAELEADGLVEARARSGFFVPAAAGPAPVGSTPRPQSLEGYDDLMPELLAERAGPGLVRLGLAQLEPDLSPHPRLAAIARRLLRGADPLWSEYGAPAGLLSLRRRVASLMLDRACSTAPDELVITNGSQEALWIAFAAIARPGETVAVESPCYSGALQALRSLRLSVVEIPALPGAGLDLAFLRRTLTDARPVALYCMPSCSNPRGDVYPPAAREALHALCAQHELPIVEDDGNRDLAFDAVPPPIRSLDDRGSVLFCGSFSKTTSPAFRVGWLAPGRYLAAALALKTAISLTTPALPQLTLERWVGDGSHRRFNRRAARVLAATSGRLRDEVLAAFPAGTRVAPALGGPWLWVELPPGTDSVELRVRALGEGVSFAPGTIFSGDRRFAHCLRLGWGGRWRPEVGAAVRALGRLARASAGSP